MTRKRVLTGTLLLALAVLTITALVRYEQRGERLAKQYCSSCHQFPDPSLLSRNTWAEGVLPEMGLRLGMGDRNVLLKKMGFKQLDALVQLGVYPDTPSMSVADWKEIIRYYRKHAPEDPLPQPPKQAMEKLASPFEMKEIIMEQHPLGVITMARPHPNSREIWLGKRNNELAIIDLQGQVKSTFKTPSPPVSMLDRTEPLVLSIGNMLPNEDRNGRLFRFHANGPYDLLIDSLHRPVEIQEADLNEDKVNDLIISEFGHETGQIRLVDGATQQQQVLIQQPGARNIKITDLDKDGRKDLLVLFAQAREEVMAFMNQGRGKFSSQVLLMFPSVYGSSFMELADMDGDGYDDLIIANGDNADYSVEKKAFHGIRIYLNNGSNAFKEAWFYPVYGATKVVAGDFDMDGDKDMAMTAYFSDPAVTESFLYFENRGGLSFGISDLGIPYAHWMRLHAADIDLDGDEDLVLGNFQMSPDPKALARKGLQAIILTNKKIP